jgi:hypothetical protein
LTAEEHNKTLATLYFVYGGIHGLTLVALALLVLALQTSTSGLNLITPFWMKLSFAVFVVLLVFVGILPVLAGYGFRKRKSWVKPLGFALAIISMVNIPIGTALGIYTIKFFRSEGGARIYGGKASTSTDVELSDAMSGTKPLMNWAKRVKQ